MFTVFTVYVLVLIVEVFMVYVLFICVLVDSYRIADLDLGGSRHGHHTKNCRKKSLMAKDCYQLFMCICHLCIYLPNDQVCGSGSAWIRINLSCWIRIRIQEGKNDPQNK